MNLLNPIIILLGAFLAVYFQSSFDLFRNIFGAQINLLPALMVYTSLTMGGFSVALLSIVGGLLFDSLSANPLGISVVPLFLIGFAIHRFHGLLLREQLAAQFAFGAAASLLTPLLTLLFLLSAEKNPLIGWGTIWQLLVMALGGGLITPLCFWLLDWVNSALNYQPIAQTTFRTDREIKRNRGKKHE
jgi:cell shape-determining protein MreD